MSFTSPPPVLKLLHLANTGGSRGRRTARRDHRKETVPPNQDSFNDSTYRLENTKQFATFASLKKNGQLMKGSCFFFISLQSCCLGSPLSEKSAKEWQSTHRHPFPRKPLSQVLPVSTCPRMAGRCAEDAWKKLIESRDTNTHVL